MGMKSLSTVSNKNLLGLPDTFVTNWQQLCGKLTSLTCEMVKWLVTAERYWLN